MSTSPSDANINLLIATISAMLAFLSVVLVSWPYLMPDTLGARMKRVKDEREAIRRRERSKLSGNEAPSLRMESKKVFKDILDRFNLWEQVNNTTMVKKLRMAGYRGQGPVVTFVAAQVIIPVIIVIVAALFAFVVPKQVDYPFFGKLSAVIAATVIGYYVPGLYVKNQINKRQTAVRRAWPDALDLLLICVESGMGLESALAKVADEIIAQCPELAEEFALMTAELSYLPERSKAYENLAERTGLDPVRSLVVALTQTEKYGTSLGQSLRVLAQETRDKRMSLAEKKAHALPPKLTVPMILFFLPVLFAIIMTPALIQISHVR